MFRSIAIRSAVLIATLSSTAALASDQVIPMHICSPDTHRAAFIIYSDGGVFYCANDKCAAIEGAPRNSGAFPMVVGCEKEPFVYVAMSDGKVFRCSAGISAPARCVPQRDLPLPVEKAAPASPPASATRPRRP